jgi:NADPH:quinone reductase-like Zn-dependent oxidoreductase
MSVAPHPTLAAIATQGQPTTPADQRLLPAPTALAALLPHGGLRRGSTVTVAGSAGLLLALLAPASAAGAHLAVVGRPDLGMLAAAEAGVDLRRSYLVSDPSPHWPQVVAALLEGVDLVVVGAPPQLGPGLARRLSARAQAAGSVLLATGPWPGAELTLAVRRSQWYGLDATGGGHLQARRTEVIVTGRRIGAARRGWLWLPSPDGSVIAAGPRRL